MIDTFEMFVDSPFRWVKTLFRRKLKCDNWQPKSLIKQFDAYGYKCGVSWWYAEQIQVYNGYVCVPRDHPDAIAILTGTSEWFDFDIEVNGGISLARAGKDGFWFGWDNIHAYNTSSNTAVQVSGGWSDDRAIKETKLLAFILSIRMYDQTYLYPEHDAVIWEDIGHECDKYWAINPNHGLNLSGQIDGINSGQIDGINDPNNAGGIDPDTIIDPHTGMLPPDPTIDPVHHDPLDDPAVAHAVMNAVAVGLGAAPSAKPDLIYTGSAWMLRSDAIAYGWIEVCDKCEIEVNKLSIDCLVCTGCDDGSAFKFPKYKTKWMQKKQPEKVISMIPILGDRQLDIPQEE